MFRTPPFACAIIFLALLLGAPVAGAQPPSVSAGPSGGIGGLAPLAVASGPPRPAEVRARPSVLARLIRLRLAPAPLRSPAQPGWRMGYGDVTLMLPLAGPLELRTGVRLDYESRPEDGSWEADPVPTVGIGLRF